ncbi:MAG: hypothetical protein ABFD07_09235 [Methanobacterium sp.]
MVLAVLSQGNIANDFKNKDKSILNKQSFKWRVTGDLKKRVSFNYRYHVETKHGIKNEKGLYEYITYSEIIDGSKGAIEYDGGTYEISGERELLVGYRDDKMTFPINGVGSSIQQLYRDIVESDIKMFKEFVNKNPFITK